MTVPRKRKANPEPSPPGALDANELLRRHFEARFQPLEGRPSETTTRRADGREPAPSDEEAGEEPLSEWDGLSSEEAGDDDEFSDNESDDEEAPNVQVVDYSKPHVPNEAAMSKRELKAFMSSRPPDHGTAKPTAASAPSKSSPLPEDAPSLLKQDLELRRLLAESHLLAPHAAAAKSLSRVSVQAAQQKSFSEGRTRSKTTDLRVQALGSKLSIHKQDNMPMQMRKGMMAAARAREVKRRREARENGIILERETGKKRRRERGRDGGGGVDRPGVGRLRGAELRISERDVRGIEGTRDAFGRRGNNRR
ncbi:hypothetical protein E4U42_004456 [Claviceps africana]|uniref:Uncharacterized protein n=1 Tax=Claviceps africana TaxID=83212 RepID=A0A8K0NG63_9HYPO|nr:hypothetical protein E4U42_004456 [Claviceps africana]